MENFKRPFWIVHAPGKPSFRDCLGSEYDGKKFVFLFGSEESANSAAAQTGNGNPGIVTELPSVERLASALAAMLSVGLEHIAVDEGKTDDVTIYPISFVLASINS